MRSNRKKTNCFGQKIDLEQIYQGISYSTNSESEMIISPGQETSGISKIQKNIRFLVMTVSYGMGQKLDNHESSNVTKFNSCKMLKKDVRSWMISVRTCWAIAAAVVLASMVCPSLGMLKSYTNIIQIYYTSFKDLMYTYMFIFF